MAAKTTYSFPPLYSLYIYNLQLELPVLTVYLLYFYKFSIFASLTSFIHVSICARVFYQAYVLILVLHLFHWQLLSSLIFLFSLYSSLLSFSCWDLTFSKQIPTSLNTSLSLFNILIIYLQLSQIFPFFSHDSFIIGTLPHKHLPIGFY